MEIIEFPIWLYSIKADVEISRKKSKRSGCTGVCVCAPTRKHTHFHMHRTTGIESHRSTEIQMCTARYRKICRCMHAHAHVHVYTHTHTHTHH